MVEWVYKATDKKVDYAATMILAEKRGFICRSAHNREGAWIGNVRDVRVGDLIHFYYKRPNADARAIGSFEVVTPASHPRPDLFGERLNESDLWTITAPSFVAELTKLGGYAPDPRLDVFVGWPIQRRGVAPEYRDAMFPGMGTLHPYTSRAWTSDLKQFWDRRHGPEAHALFQAWRTDHQDGTFLTFETRSRATLHGARCQHLGSGPPYFQLTDGFGSLTTKQKVCGPEQQLITWAAANTFTVTACQHCVSAGLVDGSMGAHPGPGTTDEPNPQSRTSLEDELEVVRSRFEDPFDPIGLEDARQRVLASIVRRQGGRAFRESLLVAYGRACAISGCTITAILEAAHIVPYRGPETNHVQNGLLLRADLHTLFDLGLLTVDSPSRTIVVADELRSSEYGVFHGSKLRATTSPALAPSASALSEHQATVFRGNRDRPAGTPR